MRSRTKKLVSMLCVAAMLVSALPVAAFAADGETHDEAAHANVYEVAPDTQLKGDVGVMKAPALLAAPQAELATVATFAGKAIPTGTIFTISGSTSNSKGSATYNGSAMTECLKMESGTNIAFTADAESNLIMVFASSEGGKSVKVDGTAYTTESDGTCTVKVAAGSHTVTKGDSINLFYIELASLHTHTVVNVPAVPVTCLSDGMTAGTKCSDCGKILSGCEVIKSTGTHTYGTDNMCTGCGMVKHDTHTWDTGTVTTQPTCTAKGVKTFKCTVDKCEETKTEDVNALGHDLSVDVPAQTGNCTTPSWAAHKKCSRCDYSNKVEVPAPGHTDTNGDGICEVCNQEISKPLNGAGGWFETIYVETNQFNPGDVTEVSWIGASNGELDEDGLAYLVRAGLNGGKTRIDIPGLKAGKYTLTVEANGTRYQAANVEVMAYDRSGYAHYKYTDGVGAYRDDGVLKENAIVIYVTEANKNTVELEAPDGTVVTGIGNILNSHGRDTGGGVNSKGGKANSNQDILAKLAKADIPLVVRIIGNVSSKHKDHQGANGIHGLSDFDSVDYGGSVSDNGGMARMKGGKNITIEGIGTDACIDGWGLHFIRQQSDTNGQGTSFEVRNVAFRNVPEDCIGFEGQYESKVLYPVQRCWVHNCSFYAPNISGPAESDKAGGDGACDFKRGEYMTMSYCYYESYHKTNLIGSGDSDAAGPQYHVTWHHNYYKNCESRGPLARKVNIHIYNCIWDGQTSYVMDPRVNTYIFSEYNAFLNCKEPVREGAVKSYQDSFMSCIGAQSATIVTDKSQKVNSANTYANFDTNADISYIPSGDYKLDKDHATAKANILAYAGPMKAQVIKAEEVDSSIVKKERIPAAAVTLPYDKEMTNAVVKAASGTYDNIVFNDVKPSSSNVKIESGKTEGQMIVFKVDKKVDITVTGTGITLIDANGNAVLGDAGTATNLPAGIYFLQPNDIQPAKGSSPMTYKAATLTHLKITASADQTVHTHSFSNYKQTVAPTCTREGTEVATCSCGETQSRSIPMTEHDFTTGVCPACGALAEVLGEVDPDAPVVEVTGVTISPAGEITLKQGDTQALTAVVSPSDATNKTVHWSTDDETVARVTKKGVVTGVGHGTTTITATAGSKTDTITVKVVGVSTATYTFDGKTEGPATLSSSDKDVAPAGKYGTNGFFTASEKNTWRAVNFNGSKPDKSTAGMLLGSKESSSMSFTVTAPASIRTLTLAVSSTGSTNYSAVALKDSSGNYVYSTADKKINVVSGTGATTVTYTDLPAGTYTIVAPKDIQPSDADEDLTAFESSNDPNNRGVVLRTVSVTTVETVSGDYVDVTGVTLDKTSASLEVGGAVTLNATVKPDNASNKAVTWTTSNASVATVVAGVVTARGAGSATITARAGGKSATCTVTVTGSTSEVVKVTKITITGPDTVALDNSIVLTASVEPEDVTNSNVTWSVNNTNIAVINSSTGRLTGRADGKVTVTATAADGSGVTATKVVTVGSGSNKAALNAAIETAEKAANNVKVAANAAEVNKGSKWVTQADMDAFTAAIAAAKAVANKATATQAEADAAVEALNAALTTFMGKRQNGTKETGGSGTTTVTKTMESKNLTAFASGKADGDTETVADYFTIIYSTSSKVDSSSKSWEDGYESGQRLNLGGKVLPNKNAIKFTTTGAATVKVWFVQGGDDNRQMTIITEDKAEVAVSNLTGMTKNSPYYAELSVPAAGTYYLGGKENNNNIYKVEVAETVAGGDEPAPDQADKTALNAAITAAKANLNAATVSEDGSDVAATAKWVTQADKTAYNMAIMTAEIIADDADATEADVAAAISDLAAATAKFEAAKADGTKSEGGNTPTPDTPSGGGGGGGSTPAKKPTVEVMPGDDTFITIDSATKDNVAVAELTDSQAKALTNNAVKNNSANIVVTVNALDSVGTTRLNVSGAALKNMADKTDAALTVQTPTGNVKLPAASVADLGGNSGKTIAVLIAKTDDGVKVTVAAGNKILDKVAGGVTAITEADGSGSVAYLVAADGSEKLVKKSYVEAGKLHANLPGSGTIVLKDNTKTFRDTEDSWAKDAIGFAASRELFNGVNELDFAPNQEMTRAMLVTVLYRLEGAVSKDKSSFKDVPADSWYTEAVAWGNAEGIVSGKMEGYFGPDDNITREQLATILYRYATKLCGMSEVSENSTALEKFSDAAVVSGYAEDGMKWCVRQGIIGGRGDGTLAPGGFASRAEVATMLMRFVKAIV